MSYILNVKFKKKSGPELLLAKEVKNESIGINFVAYILACMKNYSTAEQYAEEVGEEFLYDLFEDDILQDQKISDSLDMGSFNFVFQNCEIDDWDCAWKNHRNLLTDFTEKDFVGMSISSLDKNVSNKSLTLDNALQSMNLSVSKVLNDTIDEHKTVLKGLEEYKLKNLKNRLQEIEKEKKELMKKISFAKTK